MGKEEKIENNFKVGFNIIKEENDFNYVASRRVEISRVWAKRLLKGSVYLMIASVVLIMVALLLVLSRPEPSFYGSTPSGKLYSLEKLKVK